MVVAWNGGRVESVAQLRRLAQETPAGRVVDLTVFRAGAEREVSVELAERMGVFSGTGGLTFVSPQIDLSRRVAEASRERVRATELAERARELEVPCPGGAGRHGRGDESRLLPVGWAAARREHAEPGRPACGVLRRGRRRARHVRPRGHAGGGGRSAGRRRDRRTRRRGHRRPQRPAPGARGSRGGGGVAPHLPATVWRGRSPSSWRTRSVHSGGAGAWTAATTSAVTAGLVEQAQLGGRPAAAGCGPPRGRSPRGSIPCFARASEKSRATCSATGRARACAPRSSTHRGSASQLPHAVQYLPRPVRAVAPQPVLEQGGDAVRKAQHDVDRPPRPRLRRRFQDVRDLMVREAGNHRRDVHAHRDARLRQPRDRVEPRSGVEARGSSLRCSERSSS